MNINKNISIWRGDTTPPTFYHLWIKSNGQEYIYNGFEWIKYTDLLPRATINQDGLMTSKDKNNLDNIVADVPVYKDLIANQFKVVTTDLANEIKRATESEQDLSKRIDDSQLDLTDLENTTNEHISNTNNPHSVTKTQVGLSNVTNDSQVKRSEMGVAGGVATLNTNGKIPDTQLPSYVDDILEGKLVSDTQFTLNAGQIGEVKKTGVIYLDTTTNISYRWSGTKYVMTGSPLTLGETSTTAYPGNKGKANANNITTLDNTLSSHTSNRNNPHQVTKSQVGLENVDNTSDINKPISTATQSALDQKVDKVTNKSLVSNSQITKLEGLKSQSEIDTAIADAKQAGTEAQSNLDLHKLNKNNPHQVTKAQVGLENVDNTSDADKPISTATQTALNSKVDKVEGKQLSTNDFTDTLKTKLDGIATGATKVIVDSAISNTSTNPVQNKVIYTELEKKYDSTISRTAKTVLAAPASSAGQATFRTLVGTDLPTVTTSTQGAMTAADKIKLDNFEGPIPESDINALFE